MTTSLTSASTTAPATGPQALRVTQARVVLSEWIKFRSLRSSVWTLLAAVVLSIGIGALFSAVSASQYHTFSPADRASFNPISTSLNGMLFAQLAIGVLGVLLISGEYSTGMIRASLTVVPKRLPISPVMPAIRVSALGTDAVVDGCLSAGTELAWGQVMSVLPTVPTTPAVPSGDGLRPL